MTAQSTSIRKKSSATRRSLSRATWIGIGVTAALAGVAGALIIQAIALSIWPDSALFRPLDSFPRTVLFTVVPAALATWLFSALAKRRVDPVQDFLWISLVVLLLSFIPDYLLPVPHRTLLTSSIAATMHVAAAIGIVGVNVIAYRREIGK